MVEVLSHLRTRMTGGDHVTPARIDRYLNKPDEELTAEDLWLMMPPEIVLTFMSNTGRIKEKKIHKFLRSLDALLLDYKPMDLLKMDEDCVKKDGSINETQLKKILTEGTGI